MGYLDNLAKFEKFREENKLNGLWELLTAAEVSCIFPIADETVITEYDVESISREDAEIICDYIYDLTMRSEQTPAELCYVIKSALADGKVTIEQLSNFDAEATNIIIDMF